MTEKSDSVLVSPTTPSDDMATMREAAEEWLGGATLESERSRAALEQTYQNLERLDCKATARLLRVVLSILTKPIVAPSSAPTTPEPPTLISGTQFLLGVDWGAGESYGIITCTHCGTSARLAEPLVPVAPSSAPTSDTATATNADAVYLQGSNTTIPPRCLTCNGVFHEGESQTYFGITMPQGYTKPGRGPYHPRCVPQTGEIGSAVSSEGATNP